MWNSAISVHLVASRIFTWIRDDPKRGKRHLSLAKHSLLPELMFFEICVSWTTLEAWSYCSVENPPTLKSVASLIMFVCWKNREIYLILCVVAVIFFNGLNLVLYGTFLHFDMSWATNVFWETIKECHVSCPAGKLRLHDCYVSRCMARLPAGRCLARLSKNVAEPRGVAEQRS